MTSDPIDCPSCGGDGYHEGDDGEGTARAYECGACLGEKTIEPFDSKPLWDRWHAVPKGRDGLTLRLVACALRSADDCWESLKDRSLGCRTQDENAECLRDTLVDIGEGLARLEKEAPAADPRHLPPRDCLVLLTAGRAAQYWRHVAFRRDANGPYWVLLPDGNAIDLDRVVMWSELPEISNG